MASGKKIFCIGQQKCATTSVHLYLRGLLGDSIHNTYKVLKTIREPRLPPSELSTTAEIPTDGRPKRLDSVIGPEAMARLDRLIDRHTAFADNPFPHLFRHLDAAYPGSLFILTVRDADKWYDSMMRHFGQQHSVIRRYIYGHSCPTGHKEQYQRVFRRHIRRCLKHFGGTGRLLVIDIDKEGGGEAIAKRIDRFLGVEPVPGRVFPVSNAGVGKYTTPLSPGP